MIFTPAERKRFTRWLHRPSGKRTSVQFNFEVCFGNADQSLALLDTCDAIALHLIGVQDAKAVKLIAVHTDEGQII